MSGVDVRVVHAEAAPDVLTVIRDAFGARPVLDPPADALSETEESVAAELAAYGGLLATLDGRPVGSLLFDDSGPGIMLRRFGVVPSAQGIGVASALVAAAEEYAAARGAEGVRVKARVELPESIEFWKYHGVRPLRSGRRDAAAGQGVPAVADAADRRRRAPARRRRWPGCCAAATWSSSPATSAPGRRR